MELIITAVPIMFFGILAGTFTGLIPGIHINLVASILFTSTFLTRVQGEEVLIFIVAMAITHTFIEFIPSIFFGAPDEDTGLATLPGHKFLLKGLGHEAIILTVIGSSIAIISLIFLIPFFIIIIPKIYPFINRMMGWFLIWISIFLIFNEKESKITSLIIFLLAGFLGLASLNLPIKQPLFPLLTGLFGSSTLIYSLRTNAKIPEQKLEKHYISKKELIRPTIATILISPVCGLLPGLGSSQAAIMGSEITGKLNKEQFLILIGSINTLIMAISFITLIVIGKSRTGAANALSKLNILNESLLTPLILTILFSSIIAIIITLKLSKFFSKKIHKINYSKISFIILIFLTSVIFTFSGFFGLITFLIATILGLTSTEMGIRKGFLMGALLIPTIIFYFPF
jgi:putative membrane protein